MNQITITCGGKTVSVNGKGNVCIIDGKVTVDGKTVEIGEGHEITITGNCGSVRCDGNVIVKGSVTGSIECGGSCTCGDVSGDINAGGSVHGSAYGGQINAGGSVHIKK